jgi:hypothetical protein
MLKLLRRLVALAIVAACLVFVLAWSLDGLVRRAIERAGSWALGVPVTAGSAKVGLASGEFAVSGLSVANPEGFSGDPFLEVRSLATRIPVADLAKDKVEIPRLALAGVRVSLEQNVAKSNWSVITDNLKRFQSGKPEDQAGKRFIVRELVIEDAKVGVGLVPLAGSVLRRNLDLPPIRLEGIGAEGGKGALIGEIAAIVVEAVLGSVAAHGGGVLPPGTAADLASRVRGLAGEGGSLGKALEEIRSDPAKAVKDLGEALGGRKR